MGKKFVSDSPIDEILRAKKKARKSVDIAVDPAQGEAIMVKLVEIETTKLAIGKKGKGLAEKSPERKIQELQDEVDALIRDAEYWTFVFEDIGKKRFEELIRAYPPTAEEKKEWTEQGNAGVLNVSEAVVPYLISATCIEPKMSPDDVQRLVDEWSIGDVQMLFSTALAVCREQSSLPFSRLESERMVSLPDSPATPSIEESLSVE